MLAASIEDMRSLVVLVAVLFTASCGATPTGPSVPLNQQFTLAPSETAAVAGEDLMVQFVRVSGDSRCPADALCIQGGDAVVVIRAGDGRVTTAYDLHTGDGTRAAVRHRDLRIELVDLQPYPFSSQPFTPDKYRATLRVTR
jgi:hypothetical protein